MPIRIRPISLSARLTVFFMVIVAVPLVVAGLFVEAIAGRQARDQADSTLQASGTAFSAAIRDRVDEARRLTRTIAPQAVAARTEPGLERVRQAVELDYLMVVRTGAPPILVSGDAEFLPGVVPVSLLRASEAVPGSVAEGRVVLESRGLVRGGFFFDRRMLEAYAARGVVYAAGRPIASTVSELPRVASLRPGPIDVEGGRALFLRLEGEPASGVLILAEVTDRGTPVLILLGLGLLVAAVLGYLLAGMIARPVQRLARDAVSIARGDLELNVETEGGDEVGRLGAAFNAITTDLRRYVRELRASRDEIRRGMERLGETLSATHDLNGMLAVVLDTAMVTLGAEAGAVYLRSGRRREIRARVMDGVAASSIRLAFGEGLAGAVMEAEAPLLAPAEGHRPAPPEPVRASAVAVPLVRERKVIGVLALYGRQAGRFSRDDLATLSSFAAQASVAIDNVYLHEETERLATTDPLTGAWNRRTLDATLTREVDRAQRFDHPLSVLMIDVDRFKAVNDRLGHQAGDEVLAEIARRIHRSIRSQIDTLARFGGEEFTIVLPETGRQGARTVANKVLKVVRDATFDRAAPGLEVTVSVGVATFPGAGRTAAELLRSADRALYRAKRGGRDRVVAAPR